MKPQQLQYYKFESRVSPDVGLYPIHEDRMTRLSSGASIEISCNFKFEGLTLDTIKLYPLESSPVKVGYFEVYRQLDANPTLYVCPWSYNYFSGIVEKDDIIEDAIVAEKVKLNKLGLWYTRLSNSTLIRWRHFSNPSNYLSPTNYLTHYYEFDCILYDHGEIEFRYSPLLDCKLKDFPIGQDFVENDTDGFANIALVKATDKETNPYKIDVCDIALRQYQDSILGGKRFSAPKIFDFLETANNSHWPGKRNFGAIYKFTPPPQKIKKVLPRKLIRDRDTNSRIIKDGLFDDRKSIAFTNSYINAPTRLPNLYGELSTFGSFEHQIHSDFQLTSSAFKPAVEQWIPDPQKNTMTFSENQCPEQNLKTTDFYKTGSRPQDVGFGFESNLGNKTIIKYELPIKARTQLDPLTASLLYYDTRTCHFIETSEKQDPNTVLTTFGDAKLYTCLGTQVASGNCGISIGAYELAHPWWGYDLTKNLIESSSHYVLKDNVNFNHSHSFGYNYVAPINFQNQLSAPFLLEKAIIEIPIAAGPGWLGDVTRTNCLTPEPINFGSFSVPTLNDIGGPCVTVGLIRECAAGQLQDFRFTSETKFNTKFVHREVILSGTIIPYNDFTSSLGFRTISPSETGYNYQLTLDGFNSYVGNPSAVVSGTNGYFTGSVNLNLIPQIANLFYYSRGGVSVGNDPDNYDYGKEFVDLLDGDSIFENMKPLSIAGLDQIHDNRNVLSNNVSMFDITKVQRKRSLFAKNPWQKNEDFLYQTIEFYENFPEGTTNSFVTNYVNAVGTFKNSPYLLMPNDKITVFVSKYRPAKQSFTAPAEEVSPPVLSSLSDINHGPGGGGGGDTVDGDTVDGDTVDGGVGGEGHDITIFTGSLRVTLYGSYIRKGEEYHPPQPDSFYTKQVTKIIGDDPLLDQYEVYNDRELLATSFDDLVVNVESGSIYYSLVSMNQNSIPRARISGASYGKSTVVFEPIDDYKESLGK